MRWTVPALTSLFAVKFCEYDHVPMHAASSTAVNACKRVNLIVSLRVKPLVSRCFWVYNVGHRIWKLEIEDEKPTCDCQRDASDCSGAAACRASFICSGVRCQQGVANYRFAQQDRVDEPAHVFLRRRQGRE